MKDEILSQERLDAIRARETQMPKGPWKTFRDWGRSSDLGPGFIVQHDRTKDIYDDEEFCYTVDPGENDGRDLAPFVMAQVVEKEDHGLADAIAEFIAHARTDIPVLLAEIDRLKAERAALVEACERALKTLVEKNNEGEDSFIIMVDALAKIKNAVANATLTPEPRPLNPVDRKGD